MTMGSAQPKQKCSNTLPKTTTSTSDSGRALFNFLSLLMVYFFCFSAQFHIITACMDPLIRYSTTLMIGTSPCQQKGEGTKGIYTADTNAAAAAAAAATGSYRSRKKAQREGAQHTQSALFCSSIRTTLRLLTPPAWTTSSCASSMP